MDNKMNYFFVFIVVGLLVFGSAASAMAGKTTNKWNWNDDENDDWNDDHDYKGYKKSGIKNVIVMVPDGCDQSIQTLARWYLAEEGEELQLDSMMTGMVSTHMANSVITGSAAAATAFATGEKTTARFLGVGPRTEDLLSIYDAEDMAEPYAPIASVLEGAKLEGKATGLVATSRITHATPAAYAAHIHDRGMDNEIMEHMVYQDIDVVFGGAERHLIPEADGGKRTDAEKLIEVLLGEGYNYVTTKTEMEAITSGKTWGMFASSHMEAEMNREGTEQPSIAEMTGKAIELLSEDKDGFFLMVEGSQVDWAGHGNDPYYMVSDFIAFDDAVKVAVDFAEEDGKTLVIVFSDHNTGGMTIGNENTNGAYPELKYTEVSTEELLNPLNGGAGESVIGWTTGGHTGGDVPLWAYGPKKPTGFLDNTELATCVADAFRFDLEDVNEELFVEVRDAFEDDWELAGTTENPVLIIDGEAELPVSKDILRIDGEEYDLSGIVVAVPMADGDAALSEDDKFFIPQEAVDIIED